MKKEEFILLDGVEIHFRAESRPGSDELILWIDVCKEGGKPYYSIEASEAEERLREATIALLQKGPYK